MKIKEIIKVCNEIFLQLEENPTKFIYWKSTIDGFQYYINLNEKLMKKHVPFSRDHEFQNLTLIEDEINLFSCELGKELIKDSGCRFHTPPIEDVIIRITASYFNNKYSLKHEAIIWALKNYENINNDEFEVPVVKKINIVSDEDKRVLFPEQLKL